MRLSCNGCRVLRKGCSENCSIRPCLQWIKNTESQANATVFLAKFYGRAGLMNLINAGPDHLRPAIFRSLLYEACGRIVNPIYGSVGLLWSGNWQLCQAAVDAVLKGAPIMPIPSETAASSPAPPLKGYDIRHVTKDSAAAVAASRVSTELHKVNKTRTRFKRTSTTSKPRVAPVTEYTVEPDLARLSWPGCYPVDFRRAKSHESSASHMTEPRGGTGDGDSRENESMFSVETVDASHVSQAHPNPVYSQTDEGEVELELTLGFHPADREPRSVRTAAETRSELNCWDGDTCRVDIGLELPA